MADSPPFNIGDLAKPADTLIKKVSDAVGGLYAPYQVKRMAKAEAAATIINAQAEIDIADLRRRAMYRFVEEQARHQKNIEDITRKALPHLKEGSNPSAMDDDWVTNFFDKSRLVSDGEMQELWSRVLAGEANAPGAYSKRTVNSLAVFDKADATLFSRLCGFVWVIGTAVPLVFDSRHDIYEKRGIHAHALRYLDTIGLIQFELHGFLWSQMPERIQASYHGHRVVLDFERDSFYGGQVQFTKMGLELSRVCDRSPVDGFWEYIIRR